MRDSQILRNADHTERLTEEGCYIAELSNDPADAELSIARARVPAGATTRWHRLREITERYVIIEGAGVVEVGAQAATFVATGDVVWIPPGVRQRIHNPGPGDLVFLALCMPRFTWAAYEDVDPEPRGT